MAGRSTSDMRCTPRSASSKSSRVARSERALGQDELQHRVGRVEPGQVAGLRELAQEVGHLDRGHGRLEALVAGLGAGPLDRLLDGVGGEHAEHDGHAGVELHPLDAGRALAGHVLVVARRAADHRAQADHRVEVARGGEALGHERQLERARRPRDGDRCLVDAVAQQAVAATGQQPLGDEVVEAAAGDGDAQAVAAELAAHIGGSAAIGRHRGPPAGGPSAPSWCGGSGCCGDWARPRAAPARRSRGRIPRDHRTWPGCWSVTALS